MRQRLSVALCLLACAAPAFAQRQISADQKAALLQQEWTRIVREVSAERGLVVRDNRLRPADPSAQSFRREVEAAYREIVDRLMADARLDPFFEVDQRLINQVTPPDEADWVARLKTSGLDGKAAKSLNQNATNPNGSGGAEHSGFSDLIGIATDFKDVIATDDTAISLNLNALAFVGLKDDDVFSAQSIYRQHDGLRRLGGTFTFGAKVPESQITGFAGLPTASRLLDVFVWDAKYRVYGDRDPRSSRWYRDMLGTMGGLTEIVANVGALAPVQDLAILQPILEDALGLALERVKARVSNSTQITVKASGQHLTKEEGKNKFSYGVLADKGVGDTDFTFNLFYSATDGIRDGTNPSPYRARTITGVIGVSSLFAKNAIVPGRAMSLGVDFGFDRPVKKEGPRRSLDTLWRVVGTVSLPFGKAALVPVSITYTNDPNNLEKQSYVTGQLGIAYDFGALKNLFAE